METVLNDNNSYNSIKYNISESVKKHYQKENDTNENAKPKANTTRIRTQHQSLIVQYLKQSRIHGKTAKTN